MSGKTHRLQIGDITCIVLHEGPALDPAQASPSQTVTDVQDRFPNATEAEVEAALQTYGTPPPSMNALYIESAGTKILVDTGMGAATKPRLGYCADALEAEGIGVDDVDIVFITHFHGDHYKGLLNEDGTPHYPNGRLVTTKTEWDHWLGDEPSRPELGSEIQKVTAPFKDTVLLLNAGDSLAPGVTLVDMAGHTPGHTGLLIESNGERLLDVVDLLHSLAQFKYTHWHFRFDSYADLAVQNREAMLARAADENLLTLFYHLPFPGLGHITRTPDGAFAFAAV